MASIFDNPAPALFQDPRYSGLLSAYGPLETAFRAAYAPPPAGTSIYRPGMPGSIPGAPQQPVYQPGPGSIWDTGGNTAGNQSAVAPGAAPSPNDVQSQMGPMGMMSPAGLAMGAAGLAPGPVGGIATLAKMANMLGPPANISPDVIGLVNNPQALAQTIAMLDPDGTQAIAPDVNSALFDIVVAQQHAGSQAPSAVTPADQEAVGAIGIDVGNTGDGAASGDSGTVICTELFNRGWLDEATYQDDVIFGLRQTDEVVAGYHLWAKPYVRLMQRPGILGALATALAVAIALPWAKAMRASVRGQRSPLIGGLIMAVGLPVCRWLGRDRGRAEKYV